MASRKNPLLKSEYQDVTRKTRRDFLKTAGAVTGGAYGLAGTMGILGFRIWGRCCA